MTSDLLYMQYAPAELISMMTRFNYRARVKTHIFNEYFHPVTESPVSSFVVDFFHFFLTGNTPMCDCKIGLTDNFKNVQKI